MSSQQQQTESGTDLNEKLTSAGMPTIRDKRENAGEVSVDDVHEFGCPFCAFTAPSERAVRAHITQEDDGDHRDRNGYLDQIFVTALDESGERIADWQTDFSDREDREGAVTTEMLPEGVTEKQRMILEVVVQNPGLNNMAAARRVEERYGYEPSDGYVSKVRKQYLQIPETDKQRRSNPNKKYDDLTETQQAIVDEILEFDDPLDPGSWPVPQTAVAENADCHATNIRPTLERYESLIRHLKARLEARNGSKPVGADPTRVTESPDEPTGSAPTEEDDDETESSDTVQVEREAMREFAREVDTMKRAATNQREAAPRDSAMQAHADGKLELIERCETFLKDVATLNRGEDDA